MTRLSDPIALQPSPDGRFVEPADMWDRIIWQQALFGAAHFMFDDDEAGCEMPRVAKAWSASEMSFDWLRRHALSAAHRATDPGAS